MFIFFLFCVRFLALIFFQIGCFVPAKSAEFRICDRLYARIGFNDNIEQNLSSFVKEVC